MASKSLVLTDDYISDVLRYLLELESDLPPLGNYLSEDSEVKIWMRDRLVNWIVNVAEELGASIETAQLSITLINQFLAKVRTKKAVLQLVGVVCLMIALKFHENMGYTLDHAMIHSANLYKKEDIKATELFAMQKMGWKLAFPTAAEISRQLLYVTGVDFDFSKIIERSDAFAMECYKDYHLSQHSPFVIALVSVTCSLEQYNQHKFRNQWLKFLKNKLDLDGPVLDACKRQLVHKLYREAPEQGASTLQPLLKESLSSLLANL